MNALTFTKFPKNGIYRVTESFTTENMDFSVGEVVGIIRWNESQFDRITKTGEIFGGYSNYMRPSDMPKVQRLNLDEVKKLTDGKVTIRELSFETIPELADVCKNIIHNLGEPVQVEASK